MPFVMPDEEIIKEFSNKVRPYFDLIQKKHKDIQITQEARDRLLPKLMSGEIEV